MSTATHDISPGRSRSRSNFPYRFPARYRVVWVAIASLVLISLISAPAVLERDSMRLVTALGGVLALAGVGQLLVMMQGGIDLSVPAIVTIAAAVVVKQADSAALAVVIVEALLLCALAGLINGLLVAVARLNAVIVTLATAGLFTGALELWTGATFSTSGAVPAGLGDFATREVGPISVIFLVMVVVLLITGTVLRRTRVGRSYVEVGTNPVAARVVGLRPTAHQIAAFTLAGVLYGAAGILLAGLLGNPDTTIGTPYQLTTIVAVALGGAALGGGPASVTGTAAAAFFVVLLDQYLATRGIEAGVRVLMQGVALIVAVALVTATSGSGGVVSWFRTRFPLSASARPRR